MSYLDLLVDEQIRQAMERGEFDDLTGAGKPLADLDRQRQAGWFAERLVRRERSRVLHEDTLADLADRRVGFWRAPSIADLRRLVTEANRTIAAANGRLEPDDRIAPFDLHEVAADWRAIRRPAPRG
jgi:hypothetical protein